MSTGMAKIKLRAVTSVGEDVAKLESSHTGGRNAQCTNSLAVPLKVKQSYHMTQV